MKIKEIIELLWHIGMSSGSGAKDASSIIAHQGKN